MASATCELIWLKQLLKEFKFGEITHLYVIIRMLFILACTALVVGSDDVASSYYIGVLDGTPGWQKGRKSGGSCSRRLLSWRAPISSIPKLAVTGLKMKSPDVNPGDQVIRDRRNKDIAEDEVR